MRRLVTPLSRAPMRGAFLQRDTVRLLVKFFEVIDENNDSGFTGANYDWSHYIAGLDESYKHERRRTTRLKILQTLHGAFLALQSHAKSQIEAAIADARRCTDTSIYSLPDELLSKILVTSQELTHQSMANGKASYASAPSKQPEVIFSQVSRRFRSIALGTGSLWSFVQLNFPLSQIDTYLTRSPNAALCISFGAIYSPGTDEDLAEEMKVRKEHYLSKVLPSCSQWTSIHFRLSDGKYSPGYTAWIQDFMTASLHPVPMLHEIHYLKDYSSVYTHNLPGTSRLTESMEHNVQSCRCVEWLPDLKYAAQLRSFAFSVTKLSISLHYELIDILSQMYTLEDLELELKTNPTEDLRSDGTVLFPSLRTLVVKNNTSNAVYKDVILSEWRYPLLRRLEYNSIHDESYDISSLISNREPMLELTDVCCCIKWSTYTPSRLLHELSSAAPNILHLELRQISRRVVLPWDIDQVPFHSDEGVKPWIEYFPFLSRLSLQGCDWITNATVLEYIRHLDATDAWGDVESLELIHCEGINSVHLYDDIGRYFPEAERVRAKIRTHEGSMSSGWKTAASLDHSL